MLKESDLNSKQRRVVNHRNGNLMVIAPPGGGKTASMVHRVKELIKDGTPYWRIGLMTFNTKAKDELKQRIIEHIESDKEFRDAMERFKAWDEEEQEWNTSNISTINSLAYKVLRYESNENSPSSFDSVETYSTSAQKTLFQEILKEIVEDKELERGLKEDSIKEFVDGSFNKVDGIKREVERAIVERRGCEPRNVYISDDLKKSPQQYLEFFRNHLDEISDLYIEKQIENESVTFKGQLYFANKFLEKREVREKWRDKYDEIIVDEAQDLNEIKYEMIKKVAGPDTRITFVGDAAQTIYSWRGASPEILTVRFKDDFDPEIVRLDTNYRSTNRVVQMNNYIRKQMSDISNYQTKSAKGIRPGSYGYPRLNKTDKDRLENVIPDGKYRQAEDIVDDIEELLQEYEANEIAILLRTRSFSNFYGQELGSRGIKFTNRNSYTDFKNKKEVKDVINHIQASSNPQDSNKLIPVLQQVNMVGPSTIENIKDDKPIGQSIFEFLKETDVEQIHGIGPKTTGRIERMLNLVSSMSDYDNPVKGYKKEHEYKHKMAVMSKDERQKNARLMNIELMDEMWEESDGSMRDFLENFKEETEEGVVISTIHKAKGQEWKAVILTDLDRWSIASDEDERLFYTAVSRAEEKVIFSTLGDLSTDFKNLIQDFTLEAKHERQNGRAITS